MLRNEHLATQQQIDHVGLKVEEAGGLGNKAELKIRSIVSSLRLSDVKHGSRLRFQIDVMCKALKDKLSVDEINKLKSWCDLRNAMTHADYVQLMPLLGINPTGRNISKAGRNMLSKSEITEGLFSMDRNGGFEEYKRRTNEVIEILDALALK